MILSDSEIAEIKARMDAIDTFPWFKGTWRGQCHENHWHSRKMCKYEFKKQTDAPCVSSEKVKNMHIIGYDAGIKDSTAAFIARASTDIPRLIESVEELRKKLEITEEALEFYVELHDTDDGDWDSDYKDLGFTARGALKAIRGEKE